MLGLKQQWPTRQVTLCAAFVSKQCANLPCQAVRLCPLSGIAGYNSTTLLSSPPVMDVPVGAPVSFIALGGYHSCVLLTNGSVRCWGGNDRGQLGYNNTLEIHAPIPVDVIGNVSFLAAGDSNTCVVLFDSSLRCWGSNAFGEVTALSLYDQLVPADPGTQFSKLFSVSCAPTLPDIRLSVLLRNIGVPRDLCPLWQPGHVCCVQ